MPERSPLRLSHVVHVWLPLAGSWLLMGLELPAVSAFMARLPQATVSLAAYGGVVFPTALLIESPILMLLAASTALARDEASYRLVRRFMWTAGLTLFAFHALVAFTPLFDLLAGTLLGVPPEVREPARIGLRIMLPWSLSIAYRRTQQGVLIRFGRARSVTIGTAVRLGTNLSVLCAGLWHGGIPGIIVGTAAVTSGVVAEAIYAGFAVRPVLRETLPLAPAVSPPLTMPAFLHFYTPLMVTPLINFLAMPVSAAAMSRMPLALGSLAAWPALSGATFTLRSLGFAYNEVVVSQLDAYRPVPALRRFAWILGLATGGVLLIAAATPFGTMWFRDVAALPADTRGLAALALWLLILSPTFSALQSWYQGALVHSRLTHGITESVAALLVTTAIVLGTGVAMQRAPGLYFAAAGLTLGIAAQVAWLSLRARTAIAQVIARDAAPDGRPG